MDPSPASFVGPLQMWSVLSPLCIQKHLWICMMFNLILRFLSFLGFFKGKAGEMTLYFLLTTFWEANILFSPLHLQNLLTLVTSYFAEGAVAEWPCLNSFIFLDQMNQYTVYSVYKYPALLIIQATLTLCLKLTFIKVIHYPNIFTLTQI